MSAANALRPLWLIGIADCKGARKISTDSFLRSGIAHINTQPCLGKFTAYVSNQTKISELFSHEADRFSSAAFESLMVETTKPEFPRSSGWLLIRGYYSAFFALHSLMRLHGWACTRLSKEACTILDNNSKAIFPLGEKIEAGLYLVKAGDRSPEISFQKLGSRTGGSHEALWSLLSDFLVELTDVILKKAVDEEAAQDLVAVVSKFSALLNRKGGPVWLTRVRNRVNYSHEYGAWHPYAQSTCDVNRIMNILDRWKDEPSLVLSTSTLDELLQFCEACAFLVALCRTTMKDLTFRSRVNSPFRLSAGRLLGLP